MDELIERVGVYTEERVEIRRKIKDFADEEWVLVDGMAHIPNEEVWMEFGKGIFMRRKDREVTDTVKIKDIISRCTCCRIGFYDNGEVYIVPLNFGYEVKGDAYTFYFHGAKEGRKVELIKKNPMVGFEMDTNYALNEAELACGYSARFQSIIGNGVVSIVSEIKEKMQGLSLIMEHNTEKQNWNFDEKMVHAVTVFKLEVTKISCKEHE